MLPLIFLTLSIMFFCFSCQNGEMPEIAPATTTQQQFEEENQKLAQQKSALDILKNQLTLQTQQMNLFYPAQITANTVQIQNLSDILDNLRLAEKDIADVTAALFREQNHAVQLARDQVDPAIASLQQNIQQTQGQIYVWTNNIFPLTTEQSSLLRGLQELLTVQKQQLESLVKQKSEISAQALNQTQLVNSLSQQQKTELIENQSALQDQIFYLRDEIERLQTAQAQHRMGLATLNQQINQAQKNYADQVEKVKSLEKSAVK